MNVNIPYETNISNYHRANIITWKCDIEAKEYNIYRATGRYSEYKLLDRTEKSIYTDKVDDSIYKYYYKVTSVDNDGAESDFSKHISLELKIFGDTINIFSPTDNIEDINRIINQISDEMCPEKTAEFSDSRYGVFFKKGNYEIDTIRVGYYTQLAGLGQVPTETTIPNVNVSLNERGHSLVNFWRGIENIGINNKNEQIVWATSQAAPIRRTFINGSLVLDDDGAWASGGYLADSYITGNTGSDSQQQFFLRNNSFVTEWNGGSWNVVFVGCKKSPKTSGDWAKKNKNSYTNVTKCKRIKEKPFLYIDKAGDYCVFVPGLVKERRGISWGKNYKGYGRDINLREFYVAKGKKDNAETINRALDKGKHILLTPGIYNIEKPINIKKADTVFLGLGMATLHCNNAEGILKVDDVDGVEIAGVLLEAGLPESEYLMKIGNNKTNESHSINPILISDIFARVGGGCDGKTKVALEINCNDVICDHIWLWRADHGQNVGWKKNISKNGMIVNGNNVIAYGLFIEHFQQHQLIWNGEKGIVYFYQCELPYDVPYQKDWKSNNNETDGFSAYKVNDNVKNHKVYGVGIYEVFIRTNEPILLENAMEISKGTTVKNACIVSLGYGSIKYIANGQGKGVGQGFSKRGIKSGIASL